MFALLSIVLLAAPVTVAAPGLRSYGVDAKLVDAWLDRTVTALSSAGLKVTSHSDIEQALGLERQRQLLGCADSGSSCLAELVGALGVDALLVGSVVKSESGYTVTLRVIGTRNGQELAAASGRFRDEGALLDWLDATAPVLAAKIQGATPKSPSPSTSSTSGAPTLVRWSPAFVGGAVLVVGIVLEVLALQAASQLGRPGFELSSDIDKVARQGKSFQTAAWVLGGVGIAAIAAGALWGILASDSRGVHLSVLPIQGGGFATFGGTWP